MLEAITLDGEVGWVVREDREVEVSQDQLLKNFLQLAEDHKRYAVPHPSRILGKIVVAYVLWFAQPHAAYQRCSCQGIS
jgi:hypothetical protein